MKFITVALAGLVVSTLLWSESVNSQSRRSRDVSVDGYYRRNGTYVAPYIRTAPNQTRDDNYSTRGNINPYTLEEQLIMYPVVIVHQSPGCPNTVIDIE